MDDFMGGETVKGWITPGHVKAENWTFRDIRFYGGCMTMLGLIGGFLIGLQF